MVRRQMSERLPPIDRNEAASLLGWWLEAGVDVALAEEPRNWLAQSAATSSPLTLAKGTGEAPSSLPPESRNQAPPSPKLPPASDRRSNGGPLPDTLDAFHAWLRESSDLPLFRAGAARALPHGPAQAQIMLVLGPPGPEDVTAGTPLSGDAWTLAKRMLASIGIPHDQAYVAALTCFPSPLSRLSQSDSDLCAAGIRRHIALAAPKRLLLMGDAAALAVTGEPLARARGRVHRIDGIPSVVTFNPRHLLARPSDKAHAWRDLLLLMDEAIT
jgi:DNA polymerase